VPVPLPPGQGAIDPGALSAVESGSLTVPV
jgi:hypothetical protein